MKTFVSLFVLICALTLNAQPFFNYWINNNYGYYEELIDDTLSTAAGDDGSEVISLPFQFEYFGINYTTLKVSTNGWIQFGATYNGPGFENNLADPQYKNFVCPLWDDLIADEQSEISYTTEGMFPARYFKIQWKNVKWKDSNNRKSFQIWMVEFDNSILFFYGPSSGSSPISSSVGIINNVSGLHNFYSVNISTPLPNGILSFSDTLSYNISSLDLVPGDNLIETFYGYPKVKLYQIPDTLYPGEENQVIFALLHYNHPGPVLTPPWITKLIFNTYGTTNQSDILQAKVYSTGSNPFFSPNYQIGSTVENPGHVFEVGNLNLTYIGWLKVCYFWLVFDIAPEAQPGNIIDATCTKLEVPIPFFPGIPDSSLSSGHHVIGHPLPVELVSFSAECNDNDVMLSWTTASETNNKGFEVERKQSMVNGEWSMIGIVNGNGTSTELNHYSFKDENLSAGKYVYRLKQIDYDGSFEYSNEIAVDVNVVNEFVLYQNYPNPFNPSTKIKYSIPSVETQSSASVQLKIYDVLGNEVVVLVNELQAPGEYEIEFDASTLTSGVYFYRIKAGNFSDTKKLLLMK